MTARPADHRRGAGLRGVTLFAALAYASAARAHIGFAAYQRVDVLGDLVLVELPMAADHVSAVALPRDGEAVEAGARVLSDTSVVSGGRPCAGRVLRAEAKFTANSLIVDLEFSCPGTDRASPLWLRLDGPAALGSSSLQYLDVAAGPRRDGFLRLASAQLVIDLATLGNPPMFPSYVLVGLEHIVRGPDHLAFLAALFFGASTIMACLTRSTVFALTHTVTLSLTVLDVLPRWPAVVEPLIALSIAVAAADALRRRDSTSSLAIAAAFGTVHGAGFGAGLAEAGLGALRRPRSSHSRSASKPRR
jgi:hypothetical protein